MKNKGYWLFFIFLFGCAPKVSPLAQGRYLQTPYLNEHLKAIEIFQKYLKKYPEAPDAPEAQYLIGKSYQKLNDLILAETAFKTVVSNYPNHPYASLALRELAKETRIAGDYEQAITYYQQAMEHNPSEINQETCTLVVAEIYEYDLKNRHQALKEYQKLLRELKNPRTAATAYLSAGKIYASLREYQKAAELFQTLIDTHGWSPNAKIAQQELEIIKPYLKEAETIDE